MEETKQQTHKAYINSLREKFLKEQKDEEETKARKMAIWKEMTSLLLQAEKIENIICLPINEPKNIEIIQEILGIQWDNKNGGHITVKVEKKEKIHWQSSTGETVTNVLRKLGSEIINIPTYDIFWGYDPRISENE